MAERKSLEGLTLREVQGTRMMGLGDMEIWDGADLSLLRDGLNHVILKEKHRSVAVDMSSVKYVPSGFFGMLFDWFEQGITVRLFAPQERVVNMLWFQQFFDAEGDGWYVLHNGLGAPPVGSSPRSSASRSWNPDDWGSRDDLPTAVTAGR